MVSTKDRRLKLFSFLLILLLSNYCTRDSKENGLKKGIDAMTAKSISHYMDYEDGGKEGDIKSFVKRMLEEGHEANRLINEKSPYLLQHAFNPVNWYPWGEEAFKRAREDGKPIFLSIGYSTCYWCHVMEREVFEVPAIASKLNDMFISIKVDREERPDVDRIYMQALQMMTGSGGWPMSIFMTPDLKPFWGGTYIPPESQYGRPGFVELITRINDLWHSEREQLTASAEKLYNILSKESVKPESAQSPGDGILNAGFEVFSSMYDPNYGGFGGAPKFPRASVFNFMFRYAAKTGSVPAKDMTLHTLRKIAEGGIYDQIGGGFHRYSTDERWHVPHFEKMLYDQGQMINSYIEAYQISGDKYYADVAKDALDYVLRVMRDPSGGFYSAEDAESATDPKNLDKKSEGAFYIWSKGEIIEILGEDDAEIYSFRYGIEKDGNVLEDPHGYFPGKNVLYQAYTLDETADQFEMSIDDTKINIDASRRLLFTEREKRVNPHLDDKILVAWNGYMISAFAKGFQTFREEKYLNAAIDAAGFIEKRLYDSKKNILLRRYRDGEAGITANLSDYALLTGALLDLYEASFEPHWIEWAAELNEQTTNLFFDESEGAFYDTQTGDISLIVRMRDDYDGAEPTGNSIAVMNLLRLSQMLDRQDLRERADRVLSFYNSKLDESPHTLPQMLSAVDFSLVKPKQIIIAGSRDKEDTEAMLEELYKRYVPNKVVLLADVENRNNFTSENLPIMKAMNMIGEKATAYVCEDYACKLPTNDIKVFLSLLE